MSPKEKSIEEIDPNFKQAAPVDNALCWHSANDKSFTIRGLAWRVENEGSFCRLPHRAQHIVRPEVWSLAQAPASGRVCFSTNSTRLAVRFANHRPANMPHFAVTGSDGLFIYEGEPSWENPWQMAAPVIGQANCEKEIAKNLTPRMRTFTIYLPLYAPLKTLEIGLDADASIEPPPPCRLDKPLVFYGTSITQGGCASTAGGDFVSAVGRSLNLDVINLGFSGNGRGEPELARLIAEIDAAAFILDYCANTSAEGLDETLPVFIDILRTAHPATPIVLLSKIHYYGELLSCESRRANERLRDVVIKHYTQRRQATDDNIHFIDGWALVGAGEDLALVDGVHPTSQGFALMANRLRHPLRHVLNI